MIEFVLFGVEGKINEDFELEMKDGEMKDLLLKDIEIFLSGFKPQDGDPFLVYADRLQEIGAEVKKAEEMKDADNMVF